jgi:hypothetical protein
MSVTTAVPAPPPGPGLQPPFVAPPTDGTSQRRWVAAGLTAAAVLICCLGGIVGLGSLVVLGTRVTQQQAEQAVVDYLTALEQGQWTKAYGLLCDDVRRDTSLDEFTARYADQPRLVSFTVDGLNAVASGLVVTATLHDADGDTRRADFPLDQTADGDYRVCGIVG